MKKMTFSEAAARQFEGRANVRLGGIPLWLKDSTMTSVVSAGPMPPPLVESGQPKSVLQVSVEGDFSGWVPCGGLPGVQVPIQE